MSKVTQKDIAQHVHMSVATVSRVLSGQAAKYRIKKKTVDKILQATKDLGFEPYKNLFRPDHTSEKTIGIVIPDMSHFYLSRLTQIMTAHAYKLDYSVILCDSMENTRNEIKAINILKNHQVNGLIILPVGIESAHLEELFNQDVPIVVADRIFPNLECSRVSIDNYQGAFDAAEHLIQMGHTSITCIHGLPQAWINNQRLQAVRDAIKKHNLPMEAIQVISDKFGQKNSYLEVKLLLNSQKRPTAIFALSHVTAIGAMRAIREEGLKIPEDISLVSFDDIPYSDYFGDSTTFVEQPINAMGLMTVNLLIDLMESRSVKAPVNIKLPTNLIRRNSVKRLALNQTQTKSR